MSDAPSPPAVIVPLDGSSEAAAALPVGRAMAEVQAAALHLLHVGEAPAAPRALLERLGVDAADLKGAVLDQSTGPPAAAIVRAATDHRACMIVMSAHSGHPAAGCRLGSVARGVADAAPCPVLLVPPERGVVPWRPHRILIPHDGTPTSAAALRPAMELARRADAILDVLHVVTPERTPPEEHGTLAAPRYVDQPQHEWPAWAREFLERLSTLSPIDIGRLFLSLACGEAGPAIVRAAAEHTTDLIVLAWCGALDDERSATVRHVLGAGVRPVLLIRAPG